MTAICVSGYGEGYNTDHPFTQLCGKLREHQPDLRSYSLPNAGAPRLAECTEFFKVIVNAGDISELYLHSLAVNAFKLAVDKLNPYDFERLRDTLTCLFLITPGVGGRVAKDHFPQLAEFYAPEINYQTGWDRILAMSRQKPCMVVAPDDPYLEANEIFEMKLLRTQDGEPAFHWINAPHGAHHFCQHSDPTLSDVVINGILTIRKSLVDATE